MPTNTELNSSQEYYLVQKSSNTATKFIPNLPTPLGNSYTGIRTGSNKEETFSSDEYELYVTFADSPKEGQPIDFILNNKLCSSTLLEVVNMNEATPVKKTDSKTLTPRGAPGDHWQVPPGVVGNAKVPPVEVSGGRMHLSNCNCGCRFAHMEWD
ncbi:hypothetical protein [Pseudomonas fluorescens]|uniref:hypothetical protein n=1 Tax=Pseudomonas fluorescens TaxID=294 RepID=UPI0011CEB5DB|nr:hypothetical protein [Pseudomonas fluorescens]